MKINHIGDYLMCKTIRSIAILILLLFISVAAYSQQASFKRGVIIPHWMSDLVHDNKKANPYVLDQEGVQWISEQGFDHLRIKVDSYLLNDKTGKFDATKLQPLHNAITWAKKYKLGVVMVVTSLPGYHDYPRGTQVAKDSPTPFNDKSTLKKAKKFWQRLAKELASYDDNLRFEILSNPKVDNQKIYDDFQTQMLAVIRKSNTTRMVYLSTRQSNIETINDFTFPKNDSNTALAIDYWGPDVFAFQWKAELPLVEFPGIVPDLTEFADKDDPIQKFSKTALTIPKLIAPLQELATWKKQQAKNREVYISSYGVLTYRVGKQSTTNYIQAMQSGIEDNGFSWAIYDYKSGCAIRGEDNEPTVIMKALNMR